MGGGRGGQGEEKRDGRRRSAQAAGGAESWLRAQLTMPVWPFSEEVYTEEGFAVDPGGYWGLSGGGDGAGNGYPLWRIPPAECAWQGDMSFIGLGVLWMGLARFETE